MPRTPAESGGAPGNATMPTPPRMQNLVDRSDGVLHQWRSGESRNFVRFGSVETLGLISVHPQKCGPSPKSFHAPPQPSLAGPALLHSAVIAASGLSLLAGLDSPAVATAGPGLSAGLVGAYALSILGLWIFSCVALCRASMRVRFPPVLLCCMHLAISVVAAQWQMSRGLPATQAWQGVCLHMVVMHASAVGLVPANRGWWVAAPVVTGVLATVMALVGQLDAKQILQRLLLPACAMGTMAVLQGSHGRQNRKQAVISALRDFAVGPSSSNNALADVLGGLLVRGEEGTKRSLSEKISEALFRVTSSRLPAWLKSTLQLLLKNLLEDLKDLQVTDQALVDNDQLEHETPAVQDFVRDLLLGPQVSHRPGDSEPPSFEGGSFVRMATPAPKAGAAALPYDEIVEGLLDPLLRTTEVAPALSREEAFPAEKCVAESLGRWGFDVIALGALCSQRPLHILGLTALQPLLTALELERALARGFLTSLEAHYRSTNAYHNAMHAADVLNSMVYFLGLKSTCLQKLTAVERVAALVAAAGHDVGHDGRSNRFHTVAETPLAQLYNDQSCLENMHCAMTFALLNSEGCNFLRSLPRSDWVSCRSLVVAMILDTDLGKHFQAVSSFKKDMVEDAASSSLETPKQRQQLLCFVLKACDVGGSGKPFHVHAEWTTRINAEFFRQGDEEKQLSLPPSPFCDRDACNVAESQKGFYSFIVVPLFATLNDFLQSRRVQEDIVHQVSSNQDFWQHYTSANFNYQEPVKSVKDLVTGYETRQLQHGRLPPAMSAAELSPPPC